MCNHISISAGPTCDTLSDLISAIPDSSLTASSEVDDTRAAKHSRLDSAVYWRPSVDAAGEWIQVNILTRHDIAAF